MKHLLFIGAAFMAASSLARPASAKSYEFTFYLGFGPLSDRTVRREIPLRLDGADFTHHGPLQTQA